MQDVNAASIIGTDERSHHRRLASKTSVPESYGQTRLKKEEIMEAFLTLEFTGPL